MVAAQVEARVERVLTNVIEAEVTEGSVYTSEGV